MRKIKKLICKIFGHKMFKEVYAVRCDRIWGFPESGSKKANRLWRVIDMETCERCGKGHEAYSSPLRRSEMLKRGWFIESNS